MRATCLGTAGLSLLALLAIGCGAGNKTMLTSCTPSTTPEFAYALSYTGNTVSMYTVDSCTGNLVPTTPATIPTGGNAFGAEGMVVDATGKFAYVANLMSNASDLANIAMYTIDSSTGVLTPTTPATVPTGYFPQGIGTDPSGKFVYTANSDDNTVSMFTINASTGILTPTTPPTVATGLSPLSVTVDPSGRFAYVSNEDDGTESMYTINSSTGVLTPTTPATVGAGGFPFKATVNPSGKFVYIPDNLDNTVSFYTINSDGTLTPGGGVTTGNGPAWVAVDPSRKFAYVVNRQDNTVSMFTINSSTGNLTPNSPATIATGKQPFPLTVDASGKFVYVGNEADNTVSIYTLNSDGTLTAAGTAATGSEPTSLAVTAAKQ